MPTIAYIAPGLGAVTSTFVYREIFALGGLGVEVVPFGTRRSPSAGMSQEAAELARETCYLYDASGLGAVGAVLRTALTHPVRFLRVSGMVLRDALAGRVSGPADRVKLLWHFVMGCVMRRELEARGVRHVHAHFAHVPATIAMYGAILSGCTFSFTAHANDLFERPTLLREKTRRAAFAVCISEYNRAFLAERGCPAEKIQVIHCGLDTTGCPYAPRTAPSDPPRLLSVGRFVEKKGFSVLVAALAKLRSEGVAFDCRIAGDGPLFDTVRAQAAEAGIDDAVHFAGSLPQEEIRKLWAWADVFVLPCVPASTGDQDGIPVVLMEAMAFGVPVVSTEISGIPELVRDGETGLLAQPGDAQGLAKRLKSLLNDRALAAGITTAARATIESEFDVVRNAERLAALFHSAIGEEPNHFHD